MALSDIFTVPFLVSLGITLLLVGLLGMFFVQRLQEQNHKMSSMLGLVSTMAEELNFIRGRMQMMSYVPQPTGGGPVLNQNKQPTFSQKSDEDNLIHVSDGDDNTDSESDSEENDDSDDETVDDYDSDSDSDNDLESNDSSCIMLHNAPIENIIELNSNENAQTVKIINFGELVNSQAEIDNEDLEGLDEIQDLDDMDDLESECDNDSESDKESVNENNTVEQEIISELAEKVVHENLSFIKSIDISSTLEEHSESGNIDYKKMSTQKLKSIAVAKGLIQENSKATKNAILKMLSSE